jgi:mannose-6-phosphate isomerase-like protein (cupin superfamily)
MHPSIHASHNQSLAEATVPAGSETLLHKHLKTEELYHITQGRGLLTLDDDILEVSSGDTICIAPNTPHKIKNTGTLELKILCCCSPAYSHDDTVLIESENSERQ